MKIIISLDVDLLSGRYLDMVVDQQLISLTGVTRRDSGAYLCIASNGVPPAVSRRMMLEVMVAPVVSLEEELVTARVGASVRLGCSVEANPDPILSWANNNRAITKGEIFRLSYNRNLNLYNRGTLAFA